MPVKVRFLVALVLLAAASVSAQSADRMRVTVPFAFVAAGNNCPAGEYTVNINRMTGLVTLFSPQHSAALITPTDLRPADWDRAYLRFYQYGERLVLREVVLGGTAQKVVPSKLETEFAKAKTAEQKMVAATISK